MIGDIFITQRQTPHPLPKQNLQGMFNAVGTAVILKAGRCLTDDIQALVHLAQKQGTTVTGNTSTVESSLDLLTRMGLE
jgi:hypothetical protein